MSILDEIDDFLKSRTTGPEPKPEPQPEPEPEQPTETEAPTEETETQEPAGSEPADETEIQIEEEEGESEVEEAETEQENLAPGPTYRARFPSGDWLVRYLKLLKAGGAEETTFSWNTDRIATATMDPAHICLVALEVRREAFEEYEADEEKQFGISIDSLLTIFGKKKHKGWLEMVWRTNQDKMTIREGGPEWNSEVLSETTVHLLQADGIERPPVVKLTFDTSVRVEPAPLAEAISDLKAISDYVKISFEDSYGVKLVVSSKGELANKKYAIPLLAHQGPVETYAMFSINYLKKFLKALKKEKIGEILLALSSNKPLKIEVPLPAADLTWLVAPRVECDEYDSDC